MNYKPNLSSYSETTKPQINTNTNHLIFLSEQRETQTAIWKNKNFFCYNIRYILAFPEPNILYYFTGSNLRGSN